MDLLYIRMPVWESYHTYLVAKKMNIPVLTEFHGDWHTSTLTQTKPLFRRVTRKWRATWARKASEDLAKHCLAVVTIGPVLAEKYVPEGKPLLVTTNHAIDEKDFCARKDFALKTPPRILFVGGLERRKGLHYLFPALDQLKSCGQDFEFVAVGSGPEMPALKQYARQRGFDNQVRFLGEVMHGAQLIEEYQRADVFVLPSTGTEGVPRVLQEAMAVGCPTIATDIGSVVWQLRDGAGIVVPPGNPRDLKDALLRVLTDQTLRQSLSERGFALAREYSFEKQSAGIASFVASTIPADLLARP